MIQPSEPLTGEPPVPQNRPDPVWGTASPPAVRPDAEPARDARRLARDGADALAAWAARTIDAYPRPLPPLSRHWDASIAGLARQVPYMPKIATKPLELLDGLGALHVGPERVGFDGKEIDWDRVVEIRTAPAWTRLSATALEADLSEYLSFLPRVPGRAWAVRTMCGLTLSLYLALLPESDEGSVRFPGGISGADWASRWAVTQIVYRRKLTGKATERDARTAAVVLQLSIPESTAAIVAMAAANGVPVVAVPADEGELAEIVSRASSWRESALRWRDRFAREEGED